MIILANIFSLFGILTGLFSSLQKRKNKLVFYTVFTAIFYAIANFLANSRAAGFSNLLASVRYYAIYKKVKYIGIYIVFIAVTVGIILVNNTEGLWCICPILSTTIATFALYYIQNEIKLRSILIVTTLINTIHDINFLLYASAIFNIVSIIETIYVIVQIRKDLKAQGGDNANI